MIRSSRSALIAALLATATLSVAWATQPVHQTPHPAQPAAKGQPAMPDSCAAMTKMCDEMMAKQTKSDADLDRLLAAMNSASGSARVDAMAALINELVTRRADDRNDMMHMAPAMQRHMMQHMMASAPADMHETMMQAMDECPMMHDPAAEGH